MLQTAVQQSLLFRKAARQAQLPQRPQRFRANPEHRAAEEIEAESLRLDAHFRRELEHFRTGLPPGRLQRNGWARKSKRARADHADAGVSLERAHDRLSDAGAGQEVEQRSPPPKGAQIRYAPAVVRFLAVNLADV